jgi:hypothetical protein
VRLLRLAEEAGELFFRQVREGHSSEPTLRKQPPQSCPRRTRDYVRG